jgi:hypothetical protein
VRLVRGARRAHVGRPTRRGEGRGQLRHRPGPGHARPGGGDGGRAGGRGGGDRLRAGAGGRRERGRGRAGRRGGCRAARLAASGAGGVAAGRGGVGAVAGVHERAVGPLGCASAGHAGAVLGGLAVPGRRRSAGPGPHRQHGHAHRRRHARGIPVFGVASGRGRASCRALLRHERADHRLPAAGAVLRSAGQRPRLVCHPGASGTRGPPGATRRRRWHGDAGAGRAGGRGRRVARASQARRSPSTVG